MKCFTFFFLPLSDQLELCICTALTMRLHFRRLVIAIVIISIILIISIYSYGKYHYRWKSPTHMIGRLNVKQIELPRQTWRSDSIFWDGNSGVRKLSPKSEKVKVIDRDAVLRFGLIQQQDSDKSDLKWANLTNYQKEYIIDKDLLMAELVNYNLNIHQSDRIPLDRDVPDSRPQGYVVICEFHHHHHHHSCMDSVLQNFKNSD